MRLYACIVIIAVCTPLFPLQAVLGQGAKESVEERLYTDNRLAEAREALLGYTFKDGKIGKVFARDNRDVIAVLLKITKKGGDIREVRIHVNLRTEKGLNLLKTLDDLNDPDFKALVEKLKLKN